MAYLAKAYQMLVVGLGQFNSAVGTLDNVTQSNAASAEESDSAAEELNAQAEVLRTEVDSLRLLIEGDTQATFA